MTTAIVNAHLLFLCPCLELRSLIDTSLLSRTQQRYYIFWFNKCIFYQFLEILKQRIIPKDGIHSHRWSRRRWNCWLHVVFGFIHFVHVIVFLWCFQLWWGWRRRWLSRCRLVNDRSFFGNDNRIFINIKDGQIYKKRRSIRFMLASIVRKKCNM